MTIKDWLANTAKILNTAWGIDSTFSNTVANLLLYFFYYNLNPVITSGWRDPEYQKELLRRYEAGDKSIIVRPAANSQHSITKGGKPAALAIDISTNNHDLAARIAVAVGAKAGLYFSTPDPVHFYA